MKFVRLGDYVINVSEIRAIRRVGAGCTVVIKDGTDYRIANVGEETFENAMAYICCGGADDAKTNKG